MFLFHLAKAALTSLPTAHFVVLWLLFHFQQALLVQAFLLKTETLCKLPQVSAAPRSLLFSSLTIALFSLHCPLLRLSFFSGTSDGNCLLSPPLLSNYNGYRNSRFLRATMQQMSWPCGMCYSYLLQPLAVSLVWPFVTTLSSLGLEAYCLIKILRHTSFLGIRWRTCAHALCVLSRLRCNGISLLLNPYLYRLGWSEILYAAPAALLTQDAPHLILPCSARGTLCYSLFGDYLSLYDLWVGPWGVSGLLGLHGLPPCLHSSEGVG